MYNHYKKVLTSFGLKEEDEGTLAEQGRQLICGHEKDWEQIIAHYDKHHHDIRAIEPHLNNQAEKAKLSRYTVNFVFLMLRSQQMLEDFIKEGYGEALFYETIKDLAYKLEECRQVKGVLGNFVPFWYSIFYELKLFMLGRLAYERAIYKGPEQTVDGLHLIPGMTVLSVHIPSGLPFTRTLREESYQRAYHFFEEERKNGPLICVCDSWLMWPQLADILPPHLNLVDFIKEWHIYEIEETEDFPDAWRVFGQEDIKDVQSLEVKTSLQKAIAGWLQEGKKTVIGKGIKIYRN